MNPDILQMMRDPIGAPLHPVLVQVLLLITWAIHILFATLATGTSAFTLYAFLFKKSDPYWQQLGKLTARLTPNSIGLAIVTGIAPLLFVQTIYDPLWYASATLNGTWTVFFIFIMMGAYSLSYLFYLKGSQKGGRYILSAIASFLLLITAGWIMHVLAETSIRPEHWKEWYVKSGVVDTRGIVFHEWNLPRALFLLPMQALLSLSVAFIFVAHLLLRRGDTDESYLRWQASVGRQIGVYTGPLYALTGLLWGLTEGRYFGVGTVVAASTLVLGGVVALYFWRMKDPIREGARPLWVWLAVLTAVAVIRELIRATSAARFGYSVADYPYRWDWGAIITFLGTTVVGIVVILFLIRVLYENAKSRTGELSSATVQLGDVAVPLLAGWFAFFLGLGLYAVFLL